MSKIKILDGLKCKYNDRLRGFICNLKNSFIVQVYNFIQIIFNGTVIHGFNHLIDNTLSLFGRAYWFIAIVISIIFLCTSIQNSISYYTEFNSNILIDTLDIGKIEHENRNVTAFFCINLNHAVGFEWHDIFIN